MAHLETINVMLQDMPEKQLPEVIDFIGYLKSKDGVNFSDGVAKKIEEWDMLLEAIHAANDEEIGEFERVKFDRGIMI